MKDDTHDGKTAATLTTREEVLLGIQTELQAEADEWKAAYAQLAQSKAEAELTKKLFDTQNLVLAEVEKSEKDFCTRLNDVQAIARELAEALKLLYDETAEYITINNLGDVHHNQSMKGAKEALAHAREVLPENGGGE